MNTSVTPSPKNISVGAQALLVAKVIPASAKKEILFEDPADFAPLSESLESSYVVSLATLALLVGAIAWIVVWALKDWPTAKKSTHEPEDNPF